MKLYQFAILYIPKKETGKESLKPLILTPITEIIANDDAQASMIAARAIPEDYINKLDEVQLAVRPF